MLAGNAVCLAPAAAPAMAPDAMYVARCPHPAAGIELLVSVLFRALLRRVMPGQNFKGGWRSALKQQQPVTALAHAG